ncbi:MAG: hypothetical protein M1822_004249 [Bathelium mastoideum]|nr:MAG: hypothetical protein M1822_004249 [Bathelium mastoideum]
MPAATTFNKSAPTHMLQERSLQPLSEIDRPGIYIHSIINSIDRSTGWLPRGARPLLYPKTISTYWEFPEARSAVVGIRRFMGSTAVIAVSRRGVYGSIIPETPVFQNWADRERSTSAFNRLGFAALEEGSDQGCDQVGLRSLVEPEGLLNPENGPHVFIITPNTNDTEREHGIQTDLRWQRKINQLSAGLTGIFGQAPQVIGYTRRTLEEISPKRPSRMRPYGHIGGKAIVEVDMDDDGLEGPNGGSIRLGRWRLWYEDRVIGSEIFCPD